MASTFSFNRFFFLSENNIICYLSHNILVENYILVRNFVFPREMEEHAPVQLAVVRPALLRTQRTLSSRPLQDLPDGLLAVFPGKQIPLENSKYRKF